MTPDEIRAANEQLLRAYKLAFGSPAGEAVLEDLAQFCRAHATCATAPGPGKPIDVQRTFMVLGRNEVWHRIQRFIAMTPGEAEALTEESHDEEVESG